MASEHLSAYDRWVTSAAAERAELVRHVVEGRPVAVEQASATLLVDGDPTTDITRTLPIRDVWPRGSRLNRTVRGGG